MSIYDDPDLRDAEDDNYPPTIKFERIGDRMKGKVDAIEKFTSRNGVALKYRFGHVATLLGGRQEQLPVAEIIAGSKNLKGQLMQLKPEKGDIVDIELTELRPTDRGNPLKVYRINVERMGGPAAGPITTAAQIGPFDGPPLMGTTPHVTPPAEEADLFGGSSES